jgi:protein-tyrosine phosphatase
VRSVDRWLQLEGTENARDVGGLPVSGGKLTQSGVLLRSANLRWLTPGDVELLIEKLGLRTVIDLRTPREVDRDGPSALATAGVRTVELSLIADGAAPLPLTEADPLLREYLRYLSHRGEQVVQAVRVLAEPDAGPTLVHCAAGKDRTGVLVAMVLDAVGVEREAVVADYGLSAEAIPAMFERWRAYAVAEGYDPGPVDIQRHMPRPAVMAEVLRTLDRRHAGAAGWLREGGLDDASLERLRDRLVA